MNNSPTTFLPHMTLASINARQSDPESPSSATSYSKSWIPDYPFDLGITALQPHEFQSNSFFEQQLQLDAATSPGRAGLGIHYPDSSTESKLVFVPNGDFAAETPDNYISFSPRLDASYSSSGLTFGDPNSSGNGSLNSCWSLSMIFGDIPPGSGTDSRGSLEPLADGSMNVSGPVDDFSLETLSAAAGLTIEEFTNRIAEGAKLALEQVADLEQSGSAGEVATSHNLFPPPGGVSFPDLPGLDLTDPWFPPAGGINPADVMPAPLLSAGGSLDDIFTALGNRPQLDDTVLAYPEFPEAPYPMASTPPRMQPFTLSRMLPAPSSRIKDEGDQLSDYEPPAFLSPSSSDYSPSLGSSRQYQTRATRVKKRKIQPLCEPLPPNPVPTPGPSTEMPAPLPPIDLGSPVFDAHRGIDIEELKARAERYRLRNQGREYDKRWLLSYAGKLSSKGELLEEFRCYITGCQQVNKRRDHILIHVGAHLDQRPFKCVHCCARFLRKNECKRHELSHTGIRPFTCNLCPFPATTFVRQDLLRRHMKRTHQVDDDKENKPSSSSRPKKKIRKF